MEEEKFEKIEEEEITSGIIRKSKDKEKERFEHLEVGEEKKEGKEEKKYFSCPKCGRINQKGRLYCIYCGYVFPDVAEKTESELEPYEIKCPKCGKVLNKNQKVCFWCGYHLVPTEKDILKEGKEVEIVVDGIKYSSRDDYLPSYVEEALLKLKKGEITEQQAADEIKAKKMEAKFYLEEKIRKKKSKARGFLFILIGGIMAGIGRMVLIFGMKLNLYFLILIVTGGILILIGITYLISGVEKEDIENLPPPL